jgi:hypothetical protein
VYVSIVSSLAGTRQLALAVAEMRAQHAIGQPDMSFSQAWEKFKQFDGRVLIAAQDARLGVANQRRKIR